MRELLEARVQLRTDVDTRKGGITLTFSDPTLGEHALHIDRTPAPLDTEPGDTPDQGTGSDTPGAPGSTVTA